jgi:hypothetical protein
MHHKQQQQHKLTLRNNKFGGPAAAGIDLTMQHRKVHFGTTESMYVDQST